MFSQKTINDLQYIESGWVEHIDPFVSRDQLANRLEKLLSFGITSEYLVFVFDYVIKNKSKLRYPDGFKYFVYDKSVKQAFERKIAHEQQELMNKQPPPENNAPRFKYTVKKSGFGNILKEGNQDQ